MTTPTIITWLDFWNCLESIRLDLALLRQEQRENSAKLSGLVTDCGKLSKAVDWLRQFVAATTGDAPPNLTTKQIEALLTPVTELTLTTRAYNALNNDNITRVGDIVQKTEAELLRTPNFGRVSLNEIKELLAEMGLHLGMELPDWPQP